MIWYRGGSDPLITPFRSTWYYDDTRMLEVGATGVASGADTGTALQYLYEPLGLGNQ
jgi:hypothetical protein